MSLRIVTVPSKSILPVIYKSHKFLLSGGGSCFSVNSSKERFKSFKKYIKPSWTYCQIIKCYSSVKKTIVSDISQDIDIDELRDRFNSTHSMSTKERPHVPCANQFYDIVQETLEERCRVVAENFDAVLKKRMKMIQLEHNFYFSEGYEIMPTGNVTYRTWLEVMTLPTKEDRLRFYLCQKLRPEEHSHEKLFDDGTLEAMYHSILHPHYQDISMKRWKNHCLAHALTFDPPLLIDLGFTDNMDLNGIDETARQIWEMYKTNYESCYPFHLQFINCSRTNATYRYFQLYAVGEQNMMTTLTERDAVDLYPESELVYLSSKAKEELKFFDPNKLYIIGAYSNHGSKEISFPCIKKASEHKIRSLRLPIDSHVRWPGGPKNFHLQDIMEVLLAVKTGQTWKKAFESIILHGVTVPEWIQKKMEGKEDVKNYTVATRRCFSYPKFRHK